MPDEPWTQIHPLAPRWSYYDFFEDRLKQVPQDDGSLYPVHYWRRKNGAWVEVDEMPKSPMNITTFLLKGGGAVVHVAAIAQLRGWRLTKTGPIHWRKYKRLFRRK